MSSRYSLDPPESWTAPRKEVDHDPGERHGALSKEGDEAVARMRAVYDKRRKLMVELMRGVGFGIPVMPQGAFYVFADASNEEIPAKSWQDPAPPSSHQSLQVSFRCSVFVNARGLRS